MPKGKYVNHKGRYRQFTSPEELRRAEEEEKEKDENSEEESASGGSDESNDSSSSEDENAKGKGVSKLIEIKNPNREHKKTCVKVDNVEANKSVLLGSDIKQLKKQKARADYQKLHEQGKTDQARADLARLAIVRQQRADAAAKRAIPPKKDDDQSRPGTSK